MNLSVEYNGQVQFPIFNLFQNEVSQIVGEWSDDKGSFGILFKFINQLNLQ